MNTTAAAAQAGVTTATIRTWARRGAIAATKTAGRWVIDATSLAHRIAIGNRRTRKAPMTPIVATNRTRRAPGHLGAMGAADTLRAAFETGTPITLNGQFDGEQVYLGHTRQTYDDGITLETIGLDHHIGETPNFPGIQIAVYLIDLTRLENAPRLAAAKAKADARATAAAQAAAQRAAEEDARIDALDREEY